MERWVLDPSGVAAARTELEITGWIKDVDLGDAAIQAYMADMAVGSAPVDFRIPNRIITISLILKDTDDVTFAQIGSWLQQKVARFHSEGGWVMREVNGTPLYADVVNATFKRGGSWLAAFQDVDVNAVLTLECLPDFYGDEVTLDPVTGTGYVEAVLNEGGTDAVIIGDYPARCRVVVTDTSGHEQNGVLWSFRSRTYSSSASLFHEVEAMQLVSPTVGTAYAGAYGGTVVYPLGGLTGSGFNDMVTLMPGATTFFTHVGSYRMWLRCRSTASPSPQLRLKWGATGAEALMQTNAAGTIPFTDNFYPVDLGVLTIPRQPSSAGIQSWAGVISASGGTADSVLLDAVWLQPLDESAGRVTYAPAIGGSAVMQLRTDGMIRAEENYPSVYVPIPNVIGDLPRMPVSGLEGRPVELFVKPTRGNFTDDTQGSDNGIDSFVVTVYYRPCYLFSPT